MQTTEDVFPPIPSRLPGRPKLNRFKGHDEKEEKKNQRKCSKCQAFGHNARSCKGGAVAQQKSPKQQKKKAKVANHSKKNEQAASGPSNINTRASSSRSKTEITINGPEKNKTKEKNKIPQKKVFKPPRQNFIP